jgi:hypothetical protein
MLIFNDEWRRNPPEDDYYIRKAIPPEALADFLELIIGIAYQKQSPEDRMFALEIFNNEFTHAMGLNNKKWSTSENDTVISLRNTMEKASENAPLFIDGFYAACSLLSGTLLADPFEVPDVTTVNELLSKHKIGYEIYQAYLFLREEDPAPQVITDEWDDLDSEPIYSGEWEDSDSKPIADFVDYDDSPTPTKPLNIFLCHSSGDKPKVRDFFKRLKKDGFQPWLDEENLLPGQDWELEIPRAVRKSDIVLVCLSKSSINKVGYVQKEIKFALDVADQQPEGGVYLIPAKLEECNVPDRLQKWQWVNLYEHNGYDKLLRVLNEHAKMK